MKKYLFILLLLVPGLLPLKADEGMWPMIMLQADNYERMKALGMELTPEQIYNTNHSSIKDAVGALDGGSCTAELVSPDGLLLTNHHCGYAEIQDHSTVEHNYLKNGFWAMSLEDELPNPDKTITFLIKMEDVTDRVLPYLSNDLSGVEREDSVNSLCTELMEEAVKGTHYDAEVRDFFNGNQYILIVTETFMDVRLVGAPPESIGKFGGDTDNWMWPRQTGDFSIFRVYTGPDGEPAEYSPNNVPLKSRYYLPVSLDGYVDHDFAMVLGYPGTTQRYFTSYEVKEIMEVINPNRIKIRGIRQDIMYSDMQKDEAVRIKYANKYSESSNYWKYSIGQNKILKELDVVTRKEKLEDQFIKWTEQNEARKEKYGKTLSLIQEGIQKRKPAEFASQYLIECMYTGMETVQIGNVFRYLLQEMDNQEPDRAMIFRISEYLKNFSEEFYRDYNLPTDRKITTAMLKLMIEDVPEAYQPEIIREISKKYGGNIDKYVKKLFKKSILPYQEKVLAFLEDPDIKTLRSDPGIQLAVSFYDSYMGFQLMQNEGNNLVEQGNRLWVAGLMEMKPEKHFYPDANSTLRLNYGSIGDYKPRDGVTYSYYTTLKGVMEKEDPGNEEFIVPEELKELYANKDYGRYGENGILKVCFTTDNDITGGNSGSPVLNKEGELIGIAFDGNWESMSGDISFEPEIQKCINVDIRYVLFVIDKIGHATHLINEMKIVDN